MVKEEDKEEEEEAEKGKQEDKEEEEEVGQGKEEDKEEEEVGKGKEEDKEEEEEGYEERSELFFYALNHDVRLHKGEKASGEEKTGMTGTVILCLQQCRSQTCWTFSVQKKDQNINVKSKSHYVHLTTDSGGGDCSVVRAPDS